MTRRLGWAAALAVAVVLWAAVLAIPAIVLLLPNQWQGNSVEVPPELLVRQWLYSVAPPLITAALVMTTAMVVVAAAQTRVRPQPEGSEADLEGTWAEGVVEQQEAVRRG